MTSDLRVIGIGSALVDVLARVPESFLESVPGQKGGMELITRGDMEELLQRLPGPVQKAPGGSAANTVVGLARLGVPARLLSKLGQDPAGEFYSNSARTAGVENSALKRHLTEATGTCISLVTPDSERTLRTYLGAAATLTPEEVTAQDFAGCTHAHVEGYMLFNRHLMGHILDTARTAGCRIALDLASPEVVHAARDILESLLREYVDIVFANEEEAEAFCGEPDEAAAAKRLSELCDIAVVKVGAKGSIVAQGSPGPF